MKNTKFKPAYTVDITKCKTEEDVLNEFIIAKLASILTKDEITSFTDTYVEYIFNEMMNMFFCGNNAVYYNGESFKFLNLTEYELDDDQKMNITNEGVNIEPKTKPNIFKRFWNWITRKK